MFTIALISSKGGTGKSTIATNLAVAAYLDGKQVAILDLDEQGSASEWADRRDAPLPVVEISIPNRIHKSLASLRAKGFDLCIVDTPGELSASFLEGIDYVLLPTEDTFFAEAGAAKAMRVLAETIPFSVVMNRVHHAADPDRLCKPLVDVGISVAPSICLRGEYQRAPYEGQGVMEYAPESKAAAEIARLYSWLQSVMKETGRV